MKKAFEADTGRVLNIVINSLYSEKEIFLRELISNSSDALDKRRFLSLTDKNDNVGTDDLKIEIQASKKDSTLIIKDNGVGMSKEELENSLFSLTSIKRILLGFALYKLLKSRALILLISSFFSQYSSLL